MLRTAKACQDGKHVALTQCFYCGGSGSIILHKRLGDVSELHGKVVDMVPCSTCAGYMKQGIILIGIDHSKSDAGWNIPPDRGSAYDREGRNWLPNPYRTGAFVVMREEAVRRILTGGVAEWILKHRWGFVEHEVLVKIGAVKAEADPVPEVTGQG